MGVDSSSRIIIRFDVRKLDMNQTQIGSDVNLPSYAEIGSSLALIRLRHTLTLVPLSVLFAYCLLFFSLISNMFDLNLIIQGINLSRGSDKTKGETSKQAEPTSRSIDLWRQVN